MKTLFLVPTFYLIFRLNLIAAINLKAPFEKLDLRYISQLRVELRNTEKPEQCRLFWSGVREKLASQDGQGKLESKSTLNDEDLAKMSELSKALKSYTAYQKMSEFIDECIEFSSKEIPKVLTEVENKRGTVDELLEKKIRDYEREVESYKLKLEQVTSEKESAQKQIEQLKEELKKQASQQPPGKETLVEGKEEALKRTIDALRDELAGVKQERFVANRELVKLREELEDTKESVAEISEEKSDLLEQLAPMSKGMAECGEMISKLRLEIDKLYGEISAKEVVLNHNIADDASYILRDRVKNLELKLNEKQSEIYKLNHSIKKKDAQLEDCQSRLDKNLNRKDKFQVPIEIINNKKSATKIPIVEPKNTFYIYGNQPQAIRNPYASYF